MKWTHRSRAALVVAALALVAGACTSDDQDASILAPDEMTQQAENSTRIYDQVEFLGNPLVSEVTIVKANHDAYNRMQPYATASFRPETEQFVMSFGRSATLASTLGSVLYPDILIVDPSKPTSTAGWLSWALSGGWGGRLPTDDVVDLGLTAIFSSFLDPNNALCSPFQLPLCTDNVPTNDRAFGSTFPYLASPN
jgi:Domain of unknown function (DUF4331)